MKRYGLYQVHFKEDKTYIWMSQHWRNPGLVPQDIRLWHVSTMLPGVAIRVGLLDLGSVET